ncbi:MAG: hypothetical protein HN657_07775 [Candidatus Marinimicrobia bacterium]|jgi:tetratricopeptide (TPR) repeat protein|nr:hypothetical protein [Candidatus Neomarinimicrobiota bacterium]MBT3496725.1 hypothetical protein [Candidatus Neomarinimicrobiota bacterium]MBT3691995.1 hypothetical protein [Candidatus Neomarinimicrobiota bacterium]MBT3731644.1 hypothetical protein [Candidatus Neomarinimicrobiota bacterium]MBT4143963.1 hypothetical protein [Candidatus Neomarinimicrobiota bacterium]
MYKFSTQKLLIVFLLGLFVVACQEDPERHLKLGNWYLQKNLVDEAILEFREVSRLYPPDLNRLSRSEIQVLSKSHFNLALAYTKKGWWKFALKEAQTSFDIQPEKNNHDLIELIEIKLASN